MLVVALLPLLTLADQWGSKLPLVEYAESTQLLEDAIIKYPNYGRVEIAYNYILTMLLNVYG